jgi:type II secretory pathway component PulK
MTRRRTRTRCRRRSRGTVLIVAMIVSFALAATVLVLCRTMRVEAMASANLAAAAQASAVARGAEQYVVALITDEGERVRDLGEENFAGVRIGEGVFWILRPDYDDEQLPLFGLVEESAKVNIGRENSSLYNRLLRLAGMTDTAASSICDWVDSDTEVEGDGAEMDFYLNHPSQCEPYYPKDGPMETVEELLLVRGVDRVMLYGDGTTGPLGQRSGVRAGSTGGGAFLDRQLARGMFDLVTVYTRENNRSADGQARIRIGDSGRAINQDGDVNNNSMRTRLRQRLETRLSQARAQEIVTAIGQTDMNDIFEFYRRAKASGKLTEQEFDLIYDDLTTTGNNSLRGLININAAPRAVLMCLNGIDETDVDKLLARRATIDTSAEASNGIAWVAEALTPERAANAKLGSQITTRTNQWSADILAASGNGRAFKRVRIVVDNRQGTPQIIYRRDLTNRGWPMDPTLLAQLRAGQLSSQPSPYSVASAQGGGMR